MADGNPKALTQRLMTQPPACLHGELRSVTQDQRAKIAEWAESLSSCYQAADEAWILGRVTTLMAHFWQADLPDAVAEAVMADWLDVLGDLPAEMIRQGCLDWLNNEARRPSPAELRRRCEATDPTFRRWRDAKKALALPVIEVVQVRARPKFWEVSADASD